MFDYDLIIIGGGVGGTAVGAILAPKGFKTLLIEKNEVKFSFCLGFCIASKFKSNNSTILNI
ncbi:MAG: NAD(P)-binding protein [Candidatus Odinarchaeota archaeon]